VCGIADTRIQQQLLAKKNLTYKSALEIAQSMETAAKNMQTLQGAAAASSEPAVHKVCHRYPDGSERPIGYASRTLSAAEKNYSQLEKEALGCIFGVKRFHSYIYGRTFTLATDHKPLLSLFNEKKPVPAQASGRLQRWALTLAMYEYILVHKTSSTHCNADALSRLPIPETIPTTPQPAEIVLLMEQMQDSPVTADHIRLWTRRDPLLSRVMQYVMNGWPNGTVEEQLRPYWQKRLELSCQDGCLLWGSRVIVPPKGCANVLEELHMAHPGATRMKRIARPFKCIKCWYDGKCRGN